MSGISLEQKVANDIEEISGVNSVSIKRRGDVFDVNVVMDRLTFDTYEKIIQHELQLVDAFPGLKFNFNVTPAVESTAVPITHAACG